MKKSTLKTQKINSSKLSQIDPCVAGIDVGSRILAVCAGYSDGTREVREFGTYTSNIEDMIAWFKKCKTTSIAMESTGSYWIASFDMLQQAGFKVILANPYELKSVPGRKTDVKDCQWIQQLHSYGLLSAAFRPDDQIVALRTLARQRTKFIKLASDSILRAQKSLVEMNVQLMQAIDDVTGTTGMQIIRAIIAGEHNPKELAKNRHPQCKRSESEIALALQGNFRPELVFVLRQHIEYYDALHRQINKCESEIEKLVNLIPKVAKTDEIPAAPSPKKEKRRKTSSNRTPYGFDVSVELKKILRVDITDIPGIEGNTAMKIISEIGTDVDRFPTVKHFISWLSLCPGNKTSGGKILSSKTKPSNNKVAQALRMGAYALHHANNALGGYFRKMRARLGAPKAITATAHKMAKILYAMLKSKKGYKELGLEAFEQLHHQRIIKNLQRKAALEGFKLVPVS